MQSSQTQNFWRHIHYYSINILKRSFVLLQRKAIGTDFFKAKPKKGSACYLNGMVEGEHKWSGCQQPEASPFIVRCTNLGALQRGQLHNTQMLSCQASHQRFCFVKTNQILQTLFGKNVFFHTISHDLT